MRAYKRKSTWDLKAILFGDKLHAGASIDLDDAAAHYGAISPALARAFLEELAVARTRIEEQPQAWRPVGLERAVFRCVDFRMW